MAPRIVDLNAVVRELGKMLLRLIGENIQVEYALAPDLGKTRADPTQIQQVLMNLAVNARDAMPNGGRLCIETFNTTMDSGSLAAVDYVMLAVSDTGTGIDPAVLPRIFEPFFTTKEHGKGTGLGLSMVYGIVQQSGGQVFVYSEPGRGATFKVYLPRVAEGEQVNSKPVVAELEIAGSETILLVEDEPGLRAAAADFLRANGYTILEAHNGDEALAVASRTEGQIDLLLTDVIMPGMTSGPELARRILELRPGIHVLYMSGYTENIALQHGIVNLASQFLQKPFSLHLLGKKIREILDSKALPVTA
jgi:CheY-like chemotaxis protein